MEDVEKDVKEYRVAKMKRPAAAAAVSQRSEQPAKRPAAGSKKAGRPAKMMAGDPTVYYQGGKIHRNEKSKCYRVFLVASDKKDKKCSFKVGSDDDAWSRACELLEKK